MAYFAEISNGVVINVISVNNNELLVNGVENESKGREFCQSLLGGEWVQTSFNNRIRKQYAGIGYTYDAEADVFIAPQPYASWTLNNNNDWQAPTAKPNDGKMYGWNEASLAWVVIVG